MLTSVQLSGQAYNSWQAVADTHEAFLARLRQQPGVTAAGATNFLPFETGWRNPFFMNGERPAAITAAPQAQQHAVSEGYFEAMGAKLIEGRFFDAHDTSQNQAVAIVNEAFATRYADPSRPVTSQQLTHYAPQIGPLGHNLMVRPTSDGHVALGALDIVGVVGDIRNGALGQPVEPAIYFPMAQFTFRSIIVAIDARDGATATAAARRALADVAPTTPLGTVDTWTGRLDRRTAEPRVLMATLTAFGALAALLAALGVYGLFSWSVAARRRELAIRLTLGARPVVIGAAVLRQGAALIVVGLVAGWLVVRAVRVPLAALLFDVTPNDVASLVSAAALLTVASLTACLPAARRAMRVDPVDGLRGE